MWCGVQASAHSLKLPPTKPKEREVHLHPEPRRPDVMVFNHANVYQVWWQVSQGVRRVVVMPVMPVTVA